MSKKKYYLTLDTETATLPFVNEIATNPKDKQKIAIAKPLVYDIGWVVTDRKGNIITQQNYLVQETFFVPSIFNTAYYVDKRPIYMQLLEDEKISSLSWNEIVERLLTDLDCYCVDLVCAYNASFDFKKSIPFTETYIKHLYSKDYTEWENKQKVKCQKILSGEKTDKNDEFLNPIFKLRGFEFPIVDLWGVACNKLINLDRYKDYCLSNNLLTNSSIYFKSSAETSFQYLMRNHNFVESHTALSDSLIESDILHKALNKGKLEPSLEPFPFRQLGTTYDYVIQKNNKDYIKTVYTGLLDYLNTLDNTTSYYNKISNIAEQLEKLM